MSTYQTILAAIDLTDEADDVLAAAHKTAQSEQATLHAVTVMQPLQYAYSGYEMAGAYQMLEGLESQANRNAEAFMAEHCAPLDIAPEHRHVVLGRAADEIKALAKTINADLIVIGSHGRHGLGLLLGSTANGVLHGSPCDILTIRVKSE